MIVIKQPSLLKQFMDRQRDLGKVMGFVPTMGALHNGHLELVSASAAQCDITIVSIFVNPTQFNDPADFIKYPKAPDRDARFLGQSSADVLFVPSVDDLYPSGLQGLEIYELGHLETILEGKYRPGHFQGVCQVMSRLLKLVQPDMLFMGRKDYQQCMVVSTLLGLIDAKVKLVTCPTVREADGLAMSSRNVRLTPEQRTIAPVIFRTLKQAKEKIGSLDLRAIQEEAVSALKENGFRVDYFEIADAKTLEQADSPSGRPLVFLAAAFLGDTRLIDNL